MSGRVADVSMWGGDVCRGCSGCVHTNMSEGVVCLGECDDIIVTSISVDDCLVLPGAFLWARGEPSHLKSYNQGIMKGERWGKGSREMGKGKERDDERKGRSG